MEDRKKDHIELAFQSQTNPLLLDKRFYYEPMLSAHPKGDLPPVTFLGKHLKVPLWVSSMTGGTTRASTINHNLARACKEFGLGMGLGSCRMLMDNDTHFADFNLRDILGEDLPFYANLGICQVEELIENNKTDKLISLVKKLRADGLIIHVNPMQEWFQPEGDVLQYPPLDTIKRLLDKVSFPLIVKEVGQGIGPDSLRELLKLPLGAIEFAAFGGTNFAKLEFLRSPDNAKEVFEPLAMVGADANHMVELVNSIFETEKNIECKQLIISGGLQNFLDGYYLIQKSLLPAIYGQASMFLKFACDDYDHLQRYVAQQVKGFEMATAYLRIRS